MRKITAVTFAVALAIASMGATTKSAQAGNTGAFVVGALVGIGVVSLLHHHHHRPFLSLHAHAFHPTYPRDSHVAWCNARYRSYNVATDSYLGYDGNYHRCLSP